MNPIQASPSELATVKEILIKCVPDVKVCVFGSRARGAARKTSDLDLVLMTKNPLELSRLADLKEAFSESSLSFKVDIVDWSDISESFQKLIEKDKKAL